MRTILRSLLYMLLAIILPCYSPREMIKAFITFIAASALLLNCSQSVTTEQQTGKGAEPVPMQGNLREQMEKISLDAQGKVGASVMLLETNESVSLNGDQKFPMQSVYKFPIGMSVLNLVDKGTLKLNEKVRVRESD